MYGGESEGEGMCGGGSEGEGYVGKGKVVHVCANHMCIVVCVCVSVHDGD